MINDLSIKQYRLFKELDIDNLNQVNLIVGTNNSGKSSLLETIYLSSNEDIKKSLAYILSQRGEFTLKSLERFDKELEIAHLFYGHLIDTGSSIQIESKSTNTKLSLTVEENNETLNGLEDGLALACELEKNDNDFNITRINLTEYGLFNIHPTYDLSAKSRVNQTSKLVRANALNYKAVGYDADELEIAINQGIEVRTG